MLTLNNVTWCYHNAPDHFSFNLQVERGERLAILGPSGAGKSTLLNLIAGFLLPRSGTIFIDSVNHTDTSPACRPVSVLFQENNLFSHLSIRQNIGLGLDPGLRLSKNQCEKVQAIAREMSIDNLMERKPDEVSGGQYRRAALARCLIRQRPLLLLDEPLAGLDSRLCDEIISLIERVCELRKITLLIVSHSIRETVRIAKRCLLIDNSITWDGSTENFLRKMKL